LSLDCQLVIAKVPSEKEDQGAYSHQRPTNARVQGYRQVEMSWQEKRGEDWRPRVAWTRKVTLGASSGMGLECRQVEEYHQLGVVQMARRVEGLLSTNE
jgi:hypothetical protein